MGISNLAGNSSSSAITANPEVSAQYVLHPSHPAPNYSAAYVTNAGNVLTDPSPLAANSLTAHIYNSGTPTNQFSGSNTGIKGYVPLDNPQCLLVATSRALLCINSSESSSSVILDEKVYLDGSGYTGGIAIHVNFLGMYKLSSNSAIVILSKPANIALTSPVSIVAYIVTVNTSGVMTISSPTAILVDPDVNSTSYAYGTYSVAKATNDSVFVLTYVNFSTKESRALAFSVSGTTITVGTSVLLLLHNSALYTSVAYISGNSFVAGYVSSTTGASIRTLTVSNNVITLGTASSLYSDALMHFRLYNIANNYVALVRYRQAANQLSSDFYSYVANINTPSLLSTQNWAVAGMMPGESFFYDNAITNYAITSDVGRGGAIFFKFSDNVTYFAMPNSSNTGGYIYSNIHFFRYDLQNTSTLVAFSNASISLNTNMPSPNYGTIALKLIYDSANKVLFGYATNYEITPGYPGSLVMSIKITDTAFPTTLRYGQSAYNVSLAGSNTNFLNAKFLFYNSGYYPYLFLHPDTRKGALLTRPSGVASVDTVAKDLTEEYTSTLLGVHQTNGLVKMTGFCQVNTPLVVGSNYYASGSGVISTNSTGTTLLGKAISDNTIYIKSPVW